jgi:hypothetical protein
MNDTFWSITLSLIVLRWWWKRRARQPREIKAAPRAATANGEIDQISLEKWEAERQRQRDIVDLKKRGYTDEVITTILPVINNDK